MTRFCNINKLNQSVIIKNKRLDYKNRLRNMNDCKLKNLNRKHLRKPLKIIKLKTTFLSKL